MLGLLLALSMARRIKGDHGCQYVVCLRNNTTVKRGRGYYMHNRKVVQIKFSLKKGRGTDLVGKQGSHHLISRETVFCAHKISVAAWWEGYVVGAAYGHKVDPGPRLLVPETGILEWLG
jgi:hypothetical protein